MGLDLLKRLGDVHYSIPENEVISDEEFAGLRYVCWLILFRFILYCCSFIIKKLVMHSVMTTINENRIPSYKLIPSETSLADKRRANLINICIE